MPLLGDALGGLMSPSGPPVPQFTLWIPLTQNSVPAHSLNGVTASTETSDTDGRFHRRSDGVFTTPVATSIRIGGENYAMRRQGALFEPARSNYLNYSNLLTSWTRSPDIAVPVQNLVGPDGVANSAWTLSNSAVTNGFQAIYSFWNSIATGTSIRPSFYVKELTSAQFSLVPLPNLGWVATPVRAHFTWSGGEVIDGAHLNCSAIIEPPIAAGGWWRITPVPDILTDVTDFGRYYLYITGYSVQVAGTLGFCHAGLEIGAYPTSHIVTPGTATVLRSADDLRYPATDAGSGDLTIWGRCTPQWDASAEAVDHQILHVPGASDVISILHDNVTQTLIVQHSQGADIDSLQVVVRGTPYAFAFRQDGSNATLTVKEKGQLEAEDFVPITANNDVSVGTFRVGASPIGTQWGGCIRDIGMHQRTLTDAETTRMLDWLLNRN